MTIALRLTVYAGFLIGLAMFLGWMAREQPTTSAHLALGAITAVLALQAVPIGAGPRQAIRVVARFWPLLTFVVGLSLYLKLAPPFVVMVHALLGVLTVVLIELALSRRARPTS